MSLTFALSVNELTVRTAAIAGLALIGLLLTGWRKPARAEPRSPRGNRRQVVHGVVVEHHDTPVYRRPGLIRRLIAFVASGGLGIVIGVVTAIAIAFSVSIAVIWLTNLLQN